MGLEWAEIWRWQEGTSGEDNLYGTTAAEDGSVVVTGRTAGDWDADSAGDFDFIAAKFDAGGNVQWRWQAGTEGEDVLHDAATILFNNSTVLAGSTSGNWSNTNAGERDFAAVELASDGTEIWTWQGGTASDEVLVGVVAPPKAEGSVVLAGRTEGDWSGASAGAMDFAVVKLARNGSEEWRWQGGTSGDDIAKGIAAGLDGSVVVSGYTDGSSSGNSAGGMDFAAVKLSADGAISWRWQGGTTAEDYFTSVAVGRDGNVVMAGHTTGDWDEVNAGEEDFAAVKLDQDGLELWRWQEGTPLADKIFATAVTEDGSIILAGYTEGNWGGTSAGGSDMAAVKLSSDGELLWRWQEGTSESDWITAIAAVPRGGSATLAGTSEGSIFAEIPSNGVQDFAAISLDVQTDIVPTPSPTVSIGGSYISTYGIPNDDGSVNGSSGLSGSDASSSSVVVGGEPVSSYHDDGDNDDEVVEATLAPTVSITESGMVSGSGSASRIIALATAAPSPLSAATSAGSSGEQHEGGQEEENDDAVTTSVPDSDSMFSTIDDDDGGDDDNDNGKRQTTSDDSSGQREEISDSASSTLIPTSVATPSPFALASPNLGDVDATAAPVGGESGDANVLAPSASETSGVLVGLPGEWMGGGTAGGSAVFVIAVCFGSRVLASMLWRK